MLDFFTIATRTAKNGTVEIYPKFKMVESTDLMIRGSDFYAVWIESKGLWSTREQDVIDLIDYELQKYKNEHAKELGMNVKVLYMWDAESGIIDSWHKYCQKQLRDNYHMLDEKLVFSNSETNKQDYASKKLTYPLEPGDISAYDKLMSTLYLPEERHKLEWAIGSIVTGDSKKLQKFMVLYGDAGTGKSTVLNIIQQLFEGYYSVFDAKALGSSSNSFALEAFKTNPLVAIQHDGDLSKIEDNTRLNSLVSHEEMTVNEKFKSTYTSRFKCFLFMGTNKPVRITDSKSGLLRRLIDVSPSGKKLGIRDYKAAVKHIGFELGAIACHCRDVYLAKPNAYDDYVPTNMMGASNDFFNYIVDMYHIFKRDNGVTLKSAWESYKTFCDDTKVLYPYSQRVFKEEMKTYFWEYKERHVFEDGTRVRSYFSGFRTDKFGNQYLDDDDEVTPGVSAPSEDKPTSQTETHIIQFEKQQSVFDKECASCLAQYATSKDTPTKKWENVNSTLAELNTSKVHYVKVPENHIVIDFDIPDKDGNKCFEANLVEASKWPPTYAELSKSGAGIHLHYIYTGDVSRLSRVFDDHIEVKVFNGLSSLRRKLTKCNNLPIATISSGLPLREEAKMVNWDGIKNEKMLRTMIKRNLNKEYHSNTRCSVDYINYLLDQAYGSGVGYDVSDLKNTIFAFAANSTNQADYCIKLVNQMKFKSEEPNLPEESDRDELVFYDIEVFPNLFLVNYKVAGEDKPVVRLINPSTAEIEALLKFKLVGFNCRRYDNHILYGRLIGYDNGQLYDLSQRIINGERNAFFGEAYNISYTDVYDFAATKQSLKKWEIELGIHHQELGLPWDQPVPEEKWVEVAEYCDNDVIATEAVFNHLKADFTARQILADVAGMTVNDTTNSLTTKIIFMGNRKPQGVFNYRDMGDTSAAWLKADTHLDVDHDYTMFDKNGRPIFPGYKYEYGKSTYRDEEVGEGGYVYAEPGIYSNVALLDIASMHPASIIAEQLFGPEYTQRFQDIRDARVAIKHKDFDAAKKMLNGALAKYLDDPQIAKDLAQALKIAINSVYGLTAAKFENPFHDNRNKDNIVAKRGALFMVNLKHEVQKRGFTVAHIKTDSIKIPNATPEIIQFVMDYGQMYGYTFEHEDTYDRMCLVNDAVYIARYKEAHVDKETGEEVWWTATGTQFAVPYVHKKLFSRKPIEFADMCEAKSVTSALYLDMNENLPDVSEEEKIKLLRQKRSDQLTKKDERTLNDWSAVSEEELDARISNGHYYHFVGKVGNFCPIKPGHGGGELVREAKDKDGSVKYPSATGAKGYRWLEAELVKDSENEDIIDRSYYDRLVDDAVTTISQYGDFEWFVSDDPMPESVDETKLEHPVGLELPWLTACGKTTCEGCPNLNVDEFHFDCSLGHDISDFAPTPFPEEDELPPWDDDDAFSRR